MPVSDNRPEIGSCVIEPPLCKSTSTWLSPPSVCLIVRSVFAPAGFTEKSAGARSEEHTSELQSLMRISYAVFCLKKKNTPKIQDHNIKRIYYRRKKQKHK